MNIIHATPQYTQKTAGFIPLLNRSMANPEINVSAMVNKFVRLKSSLKGNEVAIKDIFLK